MTGVAWRPTSGASPRCFPKASLTEAQQVEGDGAEEQRQGTRPGQQQNQLDASDWTEPIRDRHCVCKARAERDRLECRPRVFPIPVRKRSARGQSDVVLTR